jgi:cholesterol oxidase
VENQHDLEFDCVVIGSGFGGAVSAMRLTQKGYRVAVLESGKRFRSDDYARTNWDLPRYFWAPLLRCFGIQKITLLKGVFVLHGSGVGGGSLVYANTLMRPKPEVFRQGYWPQQIDWSAELEPHYLIAKRMLGSRLNPSEFEADRLLHTLGEKLGVAHTYKKTEVGVYFGKPGETVADPYFGGEGPQRTGCILCGGCMVGCRHGAKNTLDQNYLYFAEKWGARIYPETRATRITPLASGGFRVESQKSTSWLQSRGPSFRARKVIVAASVLGTVALLLRNRDRYRTLPALSSKLGAHVRTNGESLLGATSFDAHRKLSQGIAIGAVIEPDAQTKIETVRYSSGSSLMRLLAVPLTPNGTRLTRPLKLVHRMLSRVTELFKLALISDWANRSVILLVMQTIESEMKLRLGWGSALRGNPGDKRPPSYLPIAQRSCEIVANEVNGVAQNVIPEVVAGTSATAHILGGCIMGTHASNGVIDSSHEVFGYPGLYVCDGSVISSNLGVNPSLTILALAERFASQFPALKPERELHLTEHS